MKNIIGTTLAFHFLCLGCASTNTDTNRNVGDQNIAHMTVPQRKLIVEAQNRVTVAEANLTTAKAGLEEAKQFQDIAAKELEAANTKLKAAQESKALSEQTRASKAVKNRAEQAIEREQASSDEATTKKQYADKLVAHREAGVERAAADLEAGQQTVELTKVRIAFKDRNVDRQALQHAEQRLSQAEAKAEQAKSNQIAVAGEVERLKSAWLQKRQALSAAGAPTPAVPAPEAPKMLPTSEEKEPPSVMGERKR